MSINVDVPDWMKLSASMPQYWGSPALPTDPRWPYGWPPPPVPTPFPTDFMWCPPRRDAQRTVN